MKILGLFIIGAAPVVAAILGRGVSTNLSILAVQIAGLFMAVLG